MIVLKRARPSDLGYWSLIVVLSGFFLVSGIWEVTKNEATYPKTLSLGYPPYFIVALGVAKIAGVIALLTPRLGKLKEWALVGFTFDVIFALISNLATAHHADAVRALVTAGALLITYGLFLRRAAAGAPT